MPRKRPAAVRLVEMEEKMADIKLEMAINEMREKRRNRRPRRRRSVRR